MNSSSSLQPHSSLPIVLLLLFLPVLLFFMLLKRSKKRPFPPGPPRLPIIGNMLIMDQLTPRGLANLSKRYGGLFYLRLGILHTLTVSTPEMARQVLRVQDSDFCNRPATTAVKYLTYGRADMVFANYGPFWRQMRKLFVMKLFSRRHAKSWALVRDEVESTVRVISMKSGSSVNVGELVFTLTRNIIYRAAFGSDSHQGQDEFVSVLLEFSKLMGDFNVADFIPWLGWFDPQGFRKRLSRARQSLDWFIDDIIDDHMEKRKKKINARAHEQDEDDEDTDMVDHLIAFLEDDHGSRGGKTDDLRSSLKLTRDNIKAIIMDIMFGGTETVASVIEWTMAELMKHPEELRKVQEELKEVVGLDRKVRESDLDSLTYLKCVVKETLRLHPPIPLILHETVDDCEVDGYWISAGTRVTINAWAIGRNRGAWEDAEEFKPYRFLKQGVADFKGNCFEFIPFGSGRRSCPGMQLGLYTLELAVAQFVHCFKWSLPDGMKPSELDMSDTFGLTMPKKFHLVVVPTTRLTCSLF